MTPTSDNSSDHPMKESQWPDTEKDSSIWYILWAINEFALVDKYDVPTQDVSKIRGIF